jgi:hypothetical protein
MDKQKGKEAEKDQKNMDEECDGEPRNAGMRGIFH